MSRKFITGVLAVALTLTTLTAAPARAGDADDVARFVGAATTLFILGKIIESRRDDDGNRGHRPRAGHHGKPPLPSGCIWRVGHDRHRAVMGQYCLHQHYRASSRLPGACKVRVWYRGENRNAFGLRCLQNHGYRVAGRH